MNIITNAPIDRIAPQSHTQGLGAIKRSGARTHKNRLIQPAGDRVELDSSSRVIDRKNILGHATPQAKLNRINKNYHSFEQVNLILEKLAENNPDKAELVSLGKTLEGRDIMALHINTDKGEKASQKPGVVITGTTHAREWPSTEIAVSVAEKLLQNYNIDPAMKSRVDNADLWVIPVVNPDGCVYSHTKVDMWRKNRRPIERTGVNILPMPDDRRQAARLKKEMTSNAVKAYGVDINRNFFDGNPDHYYLYRPEGDTPNSTWDDFGASDDPRSESYRGIAGASEAEAQALINFELNHKNIKGVLDFHTYSELILFPWGHKTAPVDNEKEYLELGGKMQAVTKTEYAAFPRRAIPADAIIHADRSCEATALTQYKLMPSHDLYPTTGSSNDMQHINGIMGFTMEMGTSFHPSDGEKLENTVHNGTKASMVFIDHFIEKNRKNRKA